MVNYLRLSQIIRGILIAGSVSLVFSLVLKDVVLSGHMVVDDDFIGESPFFSQLAPTQRTEKIDEGVKIIGQPVYTTLSYPRPFKTIKLTTLFSNSSNEFIQMGPQVAAVEGFDYTALFHPLLNTIAANDQDWKVVSSADYSLYENLSANRFFDNVQDFWVAMPDQQRTGYFGVDWEKPYLPAFNHNDPVNIKIPLKGSHQFLLAVDKGEVNIHIVYQDANIIDGQDNFRVELLDWDNNMLDFIENPDDGNFSDQGGVSGKINVNLSYNFNDKQIVKLNIDTTQDIYIQNINTNASYFVAKGKVALAGGNQYAALFGYTPNSDIALYTSAREWVAITASRDDLQEIKISNERLILSEPYEPAVYTIGKSKMFELDQGYEIRLIEGDLVLHGQGVYAFTETSYFNPYPWLLDHTLLNENRNIDYVITNYQPPQKRNSMYVKEIEIDLAEVFAPEKKLKFSIGIPDLNKQSDVVIHNIRAEFFTDPVTFSNFWEKFKNFLNREIIK